MRTLLILTMTIVCSIWSVFAQKRASTADSKFDIMIGFGMAPPLRHYMSGGKTDENARYSWNTQSHQGSKLMPNIYFGYRFAKRWKATATFSYYTDNDPYFNYDPDDRYNRDIIVGGDRQHHYRLSPAVRWEWLSRGLITLYSEAGVTLDFKNVHRTLRGEVLERGMRVELRPNLTPIGITVGKKVFGFAELCSLGPRGLFNAGIGYRF